MKNNICVFISCLVLLAAGTTLAQDFKLENSVLWKIEHKSMQQPSYLLGTVHMMCESDFTIPQKVQNAAAATDQLVLEINMTDSNEMAFVQQAIIGKQKISEQLTEAQIATLSAVLEKNNMTLQQVDNFTLTTVYSVLLLKGLPCPAQKMYEGELVTMAQAKQKNIVGLESVRLQLEYFEKGFPKDFILKQIDLLDEFQNDFAGMMESYRNENMEEIASQTSDKKYLDDNAIYWMLQRRNAEWVEKIPGIVEQKSSLIAVGVAHLTGKDGVINLLRKQGYKVTPVFN